MFSSGVKWRKVDVYGLWAIYNKTISHKNIKKTPHNGEKMRRS
jgi:hypothetical protein